MSNRNNHTNQLKIGVGSSNPVKLEAVRLAVEQAHQAWGWSPLPQIEVIGFDVPSGVSPQPKSDPETKQGALNRVEAVLQADPSLDLVVGLEGGVTTETDGLASTVWVAVQSRERHLANQPPVWVNGLKFVLPEKIAKPIQQGQEMGLVMDQLMNRTNLKHSEGMVGIITNLAVTRTKGYADLVLLAYGVLIGQSCFL